MLRFFVRRLALTVPVLLGVATLVFSLIHLVPGDPAQSMLGETASAEDVAGLRSRLGLDKPLCVQYVAFLEGLARGDLETSLRSVLAARARGISRLSSILRHALRSSLIPIVTIVGLQFGAVLTGTIITETIFAYPGLGRLLIQAITFRDYPLVQGCILLISIAYVMMNLATDLFYGFLDPRIRYE
ncbi:MAG: ABC transporter permease [Acidobacteria bacterium]|nr:ABC transporter permease [Acidobacteriota bacterium]